LFLQHGGFVKFAALGRREQFVIRDAAPKEKGEATRKVNVTNAVSGVRRNSGRIVFNAK
jgi:hypothetical protein